MHEDFYTCPLFSLHYGRNILHHCPFERKVKLTIFLRCSALSIEIKLLVVSWSRIWQRYCSRIIWLKKKLKMYKICFFFLFFFMAWHLDAFFHAIQICHLSHRYHHHIIHPTYKYDSAITSWLSFVYIFYSIHHSLSSFCVSFTQ